ncbi:3-hydroxyacyl-CoA dehydrogenase family protein [Streptomyces muensis]|uniref:3-hydroxyacyl-CoA dehydrogenase family protein n=1 Tax=Streptomyces muensis TaxID=1077944 RepID=A0A9X1TJF4_STRM4|nr:3-hydroxyacyl-CoA dehydrogenase family protein [Streptomyces muensis]MCF1592539.1 3-hydroxyacyl-CoA dehydrogenase family protein [Streptomyces muensis]
MTVRDLPNGVAVVGAGRMGVGIAHAFLVRGCAVEVRDTSPAALQRGIDATRKSVRRTAQKYAHFDEEQALARLSAGLGMEALPAVDLVVEAVPELPELKKEVLAAVSAAVPATTVVATNTSSISISELAAAVSEPRRFLGMHFFNPVPVSRLVEVIRGDLTSDETVATVGRWIAGIRKSSITVDDRPGFATSRLGVATGLEAIRMLEEGVASASDIDAGMELGYGYPIGPLRLTDLVGLDVRLEIAEYCSAYYGARFEPPRLMRELVAAGELGRKSGVGFYDWSDPDHPVARPLPERGIVTAIERA